MLKPIEKNCWDCTISHHHWKEIARFASELVWMECWHVANQVPKKIFGIIPTWEMKNRSVTVYNTCEYFQRKANG